MEDKQTSFFLWMNIHNLQIELLIYGWFLNQKNLPNVNYSHEVFFLSFKSWTKNVSKLEYGQ